jgi:dihydrofolate reductase
MASEPADRPTARPGTVFVDVGVTLDGYLAGPNRGPRNPMGGSSTIIHQWLFETASFREHIALEGGSTSADDEIVKAIFARAGAYVMGRNMFEEGEIGWPENAPFHAPVFVLSHAPREPWPRLGGTTFHFVTDGIESALAQARAAAGGKDVRISGGAATIRQYVQAGHVEEITLHIAPVLLGDGIRLFDGLGAADLALEQMEVVASPLVTHLRYRVLPRPPATG